MVLLALRSPIKCHHGPQGITKVKVFTNAGGKLQPVTNQPRGPGKPDMNSHPQASLGATQASVYR